MGSPIKRFVFSNCFGLEHPRLESFSTMWTGSRIGKAKAVTAQTFRKTHILSLVLATVPDFILIPQYEFFQDRRAVKGRAAVHFQHPADHQLISEDRRL